VVYLHGGAFMVGWLRAPAAGYGYRAERVGAWGASAGGYLR
jgi:hypothetical protein